MKTTVELPDSLVREIKLRAIYDGRKLKDVVADLLRKGLDAPEMAQSANTCSAVTRDGRTGLPLIQCRRRAESGKKPTPERVAAILLDQELGR